jgi:hypothetical protein
LQGDKLLEAYQVAFDLADSAAQGFLDKVETGVVGDEQIKVWEKVVENRVLRPGTLILGRCQPTG